MKKIEHWIEQHLGAETAPASELLEAELRELGRITAGLYSAAVEPDTEPITTPDLRTMEDD